MKEAKDRLVPKVLPDGTVETLANGDIVRQTKSKSPWGTIEAASALIIVEDTVRSSPFETRTSPAASSESGESKELEAILAGN